MSLGQDSMFAPTFTQEITFSWVEWYVGSCDLVGLIAVLILVWNHTFEPLHNSIRYY